MSHKTAATVAHTSRRSRKCSGTKSRDGYWESDSAAKPPILRRRAKTPVVPPRGFSSPCRRKNREIRRPLTLVAGPRHEHAR